MGNRKRIAVFSMTPLFPDFAMGGGQVQLKKVALHLGELGHRVTILSTQREGSMTPFHWHENVEIRPVLRFKQPYPEPYFTPIYHIANAMRYMGAAIADADIHYSHDGGLIFPLVYQSKPTVISLRSIIYPETMQHAFLFQATNGFCHPSIRAPPTKRWFRNLRQRCGIACMPSTTASIGMFSATVHQPTSLRSSPPRSTGARSCFSRIVRTSTKASTKLCRWRSVWCVIWAGSACACSCPAGWMRRATRSTSPTMTNCGAPSTKPGLEDVFVFHDWISEALIPEYYSLADVTMCIGNCVETFGNTPFESLGCGTLPIVSRVAAYRDLLPDEHIDRVDYGDIDQAAALAHRILSERRRTSAATLRHLKAEFSLQAMVSRFADVILKAVKKPSLQYRLPKLDADTIYQLAPWCYISRSRGVYHDFRAIYQRDDALIQITGDHPGGFPGAAVDAAQLRVWIDDGYVVPVIDV